MMGGAAGCDVAHDLTSHSRSSAAFAHSSFPPQLLACSTDTPEVHLAWIKTARKRGGLGFMQVRRPGALAHWPAVAPPRSCCELPCTATDRPLTGACAAIVNVEWRDGAEALIDYDSFDVALPATPTDDYHDFALTSSA